MAIQTVDLGPVKGPKGDKGDAGVVDSNTPLTYTESTADTAPATGSKLGAIVGWLVGKLKTIISQNNDFAQSISALNSNLQTKAKVKQQSWGKSLQVTDLRCQGLLLCGNNLATIWFGGDTDCNVRWIGDSSAPIGFKATRSNRTLTISVTNDNSMTFIYQ